MDPPIQDADPYAGLYCPQCSYLLTGLAQSRCPECGTPFEPEDLRRRQSTVPRPVPIWSDRSRIGWVRAFATTWAMVVFTPRAFARDFPRVCGYWEAHAFSWAARILAACIVGVTMLLTDMERSAGRVFVATVVASANASYLCELMIAGLCHLLCRTPAGRPFDRFTSWWALTQFGCAFLPISALAWSLSRLAAGLSEHLAAYDWILLILFCAAALVWWICLGAMIAARSVESGRWLAILVGMPIVTVATIFGGYMLGMIVFIASSVG